MIRINLLPVRKNRKQEAAIIQLAIFGGVLLLTLVVVFFVHSSVVSGIEEKNRRKIQQEQKVAELDRSIGEIANIGKIQEELQQKINVIAKLKSEVARPVKMLDKLAGHVPEKLWFTDIKNAKKGSGIDIEGLALDERSIAKLMEGLESDPFFSEVDLKKTTSDGSVQKFAMSVEIAGPKKENPGPPPPKK